MDFELDWLKKWALHSPARTALKDADSEKCFSYSDFYGASQNLARVLSQKFAISFGQRVAVLSTNEFEYVVLFYALQRLGAIMVPVNFRLAPREIAHILKDSDPSLVIVQEAFKDVLAKTDFSSPHLWTMEEMAKAVTPKTTSDLPFDSQVSPETPCMILYTSGTTGFPKGAILTHKMLFWNSVNTSLRLNLSQNDKTLIFMPFFHTGGWNVLTTPFFHRGAEIILLKKFDPRRVLEISQKERLTILFAVPTMMEMMAKEEIFSEVDLRTLRYAIVGGEPSSLKLIAQWNKKGVPFRQGYGLTEFGPNVFSLNEEDAERKIGSIGFANFYIDTRVEDSEGHEVSAGEIGELCLRGPMCTAGYWKNPSATVEAMRGGWFHTGDLVRFDEEGYFYVVGRKKDMFISGAENVYPAEVEQVLRSHPQVLEAAVIGVSDSKWGEVGKAFVVLKDQRKGKETFEIELKNFCVENLAKFKVPKHFEFLASLPKSDSGKLLKRALQ